MKSKIISVSKAFREWHNVIQLKLDRSPEAPGVPFKGFLWIRCAEDLTSRFEARGLSYTNQGQTWIAGKTWRPRPVSGVIHEPQSVTSDLQAISRNLKSWFKHSKRRSNIIAIPFNSFDYWYCYHSGRVVEILHQRRSLFVRWGSGKRERHIISQQARSVWHDTLSAQLLRDNWTWGYD